MNLVRWLSFLLGWRDPNDAIHIFSEPPARLRRFDLYPSSDDDDDDPCLKIRLDQICREFAVNVESISHFIQLDNNHRIPVTILGARLPRGGTFVLKQTPVPLNTRSQIRRMLPMLVFLAVVLLVYNATALLKDWNSDAFGRAIGERLRQVAILGLAIPTYLFSWDKVRCQWLSGSIVWVVIYALHWILLAYYIVATCVREVPMPPVMVDNLGLMVSFVPTVLDVWLYSQCASVI